MKKNMYDILRDTGIELKRYDQGTEKTKCPECQPPHKLSDNPLSVTIEGENAVWNCHHCGFKGTTATATNFVTPPRKTYTTPSIPEEKYTPSSLYSYFAERGISKETVIEQGIYAEDAWIALPYYDENKKVVNIKYRTKSKKFKQSPNAKRTLYNYVNAYDKDTVIFVEGEIDALVLIDCGYKNVVTLPDGAPKEAKFNEKDARFTALENCPLQATKIVLFLDNDEAGKSLHAELAHRFGKDRCWYVDYPANCKDANDILLMHGASAVKAAIDKAQPYPVDGLYRANEYYGNVLDLFNGNYTKPIEVGYPNLDEIYKVLKGTFHVVTGIPNHGKSSFLDQMLIKISENHNWRYCLYSPEHSTAMHLRRLAQMRLRKAFDEGFVNRMTKEELQEGLKWIDERFYFIETKDTIPDIDHILDIAKGSVLKHGCDALIIDPYNEVSAKRNGNEIDASRKNGKREDEHIRDFISKCKRFARVHDVVVWIVAHPTKLPKENNGSYSPPTAYDISGASHWSNQSDAILTVHRNFDDNSIRVITRKIREQGLYGKIGEAKFLYDHKDRQFVEEESNDIVDFSKWSN